MRINIVFQPFFATKPSSQGTGLGLSLCYANVKSHGGELKIVTRESKDQPTGESGTTYTISLPSDKSNK